MKYLYLLVLASLMSSCEFFEIKKYSSASLLKEEVAAINWEEVDVYPVFKACATLQEADQLACFVENLRTKVKHGMQRYASNYPIDSLTRIELKIEVSKERELNFSLDSLGSIYKSDMQLVYLEAYIQEALDSIQVVEPALKRGVPVTTVFALPILFSKENQ